MNIINIFNLYYLLKLDPSLRSFTDETAETDSETYADLTNQKHNNFEISIIN